MTVVARIVAAALLFSASSVVSWAQLRHEEQTDMLLRAAYCVGALNEIMQREMEKALRDQTLCSGEEWKRKFKTVEECSQFKTEVDEAFQAMLQTPRDRYRRYVAARISDASRGSIAIALGSGKKDVGSLEARGTRSTALKCNESCSGSTSNKCLVDCVARSDPVEANVLRCQFGPDDLPF